MQKRNTLKYTFMVLLASISALCSAQIKVEAESYTSAVEATTPIVLENSDKSVGYFDENGESLTYTVDIPESGYYQFMFRYLAGNPGKLSIELEDGSMGLFSFEPAGLAEWWTVAFSNWFETDFSESALYYLEAGTQSFTVHSWNVGVNLDYFQLQKTSVSSAVLASVTTEPARLEIIPGASEQIYAYAYSADGKYLAAPISWTSNAPNGYYSAGNTEMSETITVTVGGLTKEIGVTVANPTPKREHVVSIFGDLEVSAPSGNDWAVRGSKNGEKTNLTGPSFFWSCSAPTWWTKETVRWLVDDWHVQVIRCPMSIAPGAYDGGGFNSYNPYATGTTWNPDNFSTRPEYAKAMMDEMVAAAIENDIYVIIDFHDHYADQMKSTAIEFFDYFSKKWGSYPNVLYEIFNEPFVDNQVTSGNYASDVISTIRANDPDNIIIVGSGRYSRNVSFANTIASQYDNVACTWHGYVEYGHQGDWESSWGNGTPVIVTEWGRNGSDDGGIVQKCKDAGIIQCPWSLHNKQSEGDGNWSAFVDGCTKVDNWADSDLSASGKWMRTMMRGYGYEPGAFSDPDGVSLTASDDQTIYLPTNTLSLTATASTGTGSIDYTWTQLQGGTISISGENSSQLALSDIVPGMYAFKVSATNGIETKEKTIAVTVLPEGFTIPEGGAIIDDVEDNNTTAIWGGEWSSFDDSENEGASVITDAANLPNSGSIYAEYTLDQGNWAYDPYCGVRVFVQHNEQPYDLSNCSQISYKFRGSAHAFRAEMSTITDDNFHRDNIDASADWTTVTVNWANLDQDPTWGIDVGDIDKTDINRFSWQVQVASGSGTLEIDDLTCTGAKGPQGGNIPPIASAGNDFEVSATEAELDGSGSFDLDGGNLTYEWTQTDGPSTADIQSASSATTAISSLQSGTYTFQLAVSDGTDTSVDEIQVTVSNVSSQLTVSLYQNWTLVSINLDLASHDIMDVFPGATDIKSDNGFYCAGQPEYLNSIKTIEAGKGYLMRYSTPQDITLTGQPSNITATALKAGWNLVGVVSELSVQDLPAEVVAVKDFDEFYISSSNVGTLDKLVPGKAYFIKTSSACQIEW